MPTELAVLEMINMLYGDKKYKEALEGLHLLKSTRKDKKFKELINALIHSCEEKLNATSNK